MALNKKLIVLSGVGLVFAGVGAGVIGYKASQVADGQKQMDDSKASMGGQLSFGLASPMATMAGTAADDFMTEIKNQVGSDALLKNRINYVNLSDSIQGDLITGIAHTVNMVDPKSQAITNVGDAQFALDKVLKGQIAVAAPDLVLAAKAKGITIDEAAINSLYKADDFEVPNLKASDIRRLINNDLSKGRMVKLFGDEEKAKTSIDKIYKALSEATVISLNVGIEDIIEAASGGVDFSTLVMNQFNPAAPKDASNLMTLMGGLQNGGDAVMKSAINAVGNLNGALSAIRRLNPTAKIALGQLGTYGIDAIDAQLSQINSALMVAAFTQDIKSGNVMVAPVDPMAKIFATKSLQDIYSADPVHMGVANKFSIMMFEAQAPKGFPQFVYKGATDDAAKAAIVAKLNTDKAFLADMTIQAFEANPKTTQISAVLYGVAKATTNAEKAIAINKFAGDEGFQAKVIKTAQDLAAAAKTGGTI